MNKFKVGDPVYYPEKGNKVFTLENVYGCKNETYPLCIKIDGYTEVAFTEEGLKYKYHDLPRLLHATPEAQKQLERLYGVEFEAPPPKPTSREIVQAFLDKGELSVPCWVSDSNEQPNADCIWVYIKQIIDERHPFVFVDERGNKWRYATPFDHTTLQAITELPE